MDLGHVSKCLVKQSVKYEDWKVAISYFTKGSYMFSFDLKSGYHYVEIHRNTNLIRDVSKFLLSSSVCAARK